MAADSASIRSLLGNTPANASFGLLRAPDGIAGYADPMPGFDLLLLVNLGSQPLLHPMLGIVEHGVVPQWQVPLMTRGAAGNPDFGGGGATALDSLAAHAVYATLIPENGTTFNIAYNGRSTAGLHVDVGAPVFTNAAAQPVPEPPQLLLWLAGLAAVCGRALRRGRRAVPQMQLA